MTENVRLFYKPHWSGPASIRDVMRVSGPMVISQMSIVLNLFFDRLFLSWYDLETHMPASMSAGVAWWASLTFFNMLIAYVATFVAQYFGAGRHDRVGASVWQGIYLSIASAVAIWLLFPLLAMIFRATVSGSDMPNVDQYVRLQIEYCFILNIGMVFLFFNTAVSSLLSAMDRLNDVIIVSFVITGFNVILNLIFIFNPPSWLPFIEEGLNGAGWGTMMSFVAGSLLYGRLLISKKLSTAIHFFTTWRLDLELMKRLVWFGSPQGVMRLVEVGGFAILMQVLGSLSFVALSAANIAFTVNNMVFVPLMSIGQAVSILVGQYIGAKQIENAKRIASNGTIIGFSMVSMIALSYVLIPDVYINIFGSADQDPELFALISEETRLYLLILASYALADVFGLVYSGALRGAGDTKFCMYVNTVGSILFLIIPSLIAWKLQLAPVWLFVFMTVYVYSFAIVYLARFRNGKWTKMTVMEPDVTALPGD